ncbi:hypothetical protein [Bradyrhizobium sp.]
MPSLAEIRQSIVASNNEKDLGKRMTLLSSSCVQLVDLLNDFVFVNLEQSAGKKCLYKAGVNTSDSVALEKVDSVLPNNEYMRWTVEPPKKTV